MRRPVRLTLTLVVTALCVAYLVWKIDLSQTLHILAHAQLGWLVLALVIMAGSVWPMAWRWQQLLGARGIRDRLLWLVRSYFTAYTAGQVLPTSIGGDAMRIFEASRRHPGSGGPVAGSVLLERALGGAATLTLAAVGFVLALGRYDVGAYLWVEGAFVVATAVFAVAIFSQRLRAVFARLVPLLSRLRIERPVRAVYEGMHGYREHAWLLAWLFVLTIAVQAVRVLAIWAAGKGVGVELSPRPYYVMGPLLFLVLLVPFTINGIAVRESFFVSFLGGLGVDPDRAFATGFLFFVVTVALSIPGALILAWESVRGSRSPASAAGAPQPTTRPQS
jgi:glycosyltransferase 2 family protein